MGYFLSPNDISYNKVTNTLYIIDSANNNIVEINANLSYKTHFPIPTAFKNPECICFDSAGNYFIADNFTERIIKYNSGRAQIATVSGSNFNNITDLYCDGSNLYVSTGNDLLKYSAIDLSLTYLWDLYACNSCTNFNGNLLITASNQLVVSNVVSTNNYLSSLSIEGVSLSPAFDKNTSEYTVSIPSNKASVNIKAATEDPKAILYINGYMVASNSTFIFPIYGTTDHIVTINVYSESGETRTYKITIKILKSTNNYLSSITVDGMSLTPAFNKNISDYTVYVPSTTSSITLTPFAEDSNANIFINGRLITSGTAFTYPVGAAGTMVRFDVISESGVSRIYKVNVVTTLPPDILIIKASDSCFRFDGTYYTGVSLGYDADSALKFNISGIEGNIYEASLNITTLGGWYNNTKPFIYNLYYSTNNAWVGGESFPASTDVAIIENDSDNRALDYIKSFDLTHFFASHPANGIYSFVLTSPISDEWIDFCDHTTEFSQPYLYIRVAAIDKTSDTFDKYIINQKDISFNIKFSDTVSSILVDGSILNSSNYTISGNTVTISRDFLSTLSLGSHTFTINLNQCSPQTLTIDVVDTTPLDSDPPTITSVTGNPAEWQNTDVTLTVNATDADSGIAAYSFDNGLTWQSENSKTYSANTSNIIIKVKDNVGNIATYGTVINITKIDKTAPTIISVNGNSSWQNTPVPIYVAAEDYESGIAAYSFDNGATWQGSNSKTFAENQSIVIKVKDKAGNISSYNYSVSYIDTTAPTGEIKIGTSSWREFLNTITFGVFFKETVTVTITGEDEGGSGVKSIQYYKSNVQLSEDEVKALTAWSTYTEALSLTPVDAERFVFYVKITDNAGNIQYISSDGSTFDIQAPSISTDYVKGADAMEVTVTDTGVGVGTVSYTVNGGSAQTATPDANGKFTVSLADGKYDVVITASDALGNETSLTVPVVSLHKVTFKLFEGDTGEALKTETVEYGSAATAPADPTRTGFAFAGWDKAFDNITADTIVNAKWNIAGITVTPYTGVYDNAPHNAVTVTGTLAGDVISYSTDGSTFNSTIPQYTDAGTYTVYVKVERTAYTAWVSEPLNVVIDKKPITADMIADIPSFEYTSKPITPKPQVKFGSYTLIEDKDYTVSFANNTEVGSASVKITGIGNYTGEAVKAFGIYAKKTEVKIVDKEAPQVTVDGLDNLYEDKNVYTEDDKAIEKDSGLISIEMSVKVQTKENEDIAKIEAIAKDKTIGIYLDISLYKKVIKPNQPEGTTTRITQLEEVLTVVIPIPDNIKGKPGLALYRVHDGVASVVPVGKENAVDGEYCEINADSITLYVRNFSTYAIGFDDKSGGITPTGDKFAALAVFGLAAFGIFTLAVINRRRKRVR